MKFGIASKFFGFSIFALAALTNESIATAAEICYKTTVTTTQGVFIDTVCFNNGVYDAPASQGPTQGTPTNNDGGSGANGAGRGGSGSISDKVKCQISHFSPVQPKNNVIKEWNYAYHDQQNNIYETTQLFPTMPAGWNFAFGSTQPNSPSYVYERTPQYRSWPTDWNYTDPFTGNAGVIHPPFTIPETDLMMAVHEVAHQNNVHDESTANGYAAQALKNLRGDTTGACPDTQ